MGEVPVLLGLIAVLLCAGRTGGQEDAAGSPWGGLTCSWVSALLFSAASTLLTGTQEALSERPPGQQRLQNQNVRFRFRAGIPVTSVQGCGICWHLVC